MGGALPSGQRCTPRGAASERASGPCGVCGVAPQGGVPRAASSFRVRRGGVRALVTGHRRSASLCDGIRCHACNQEIGRITVVSFGVAITGGHTGCNPSFDLGLQPPTVFVVSCRLDGNCPRHSRRQSVVRDSPVRAQTSRHRRKRAGERSGCAGCSAASVSSSLPRALLTSADATRWRITVATLCASRCAIRSRPPDPVDSLIFRQWVGTDYELRSGRNSAAPGRPSPAENRGSRLTTLSPCASWFGPEW